MALGYDDATIARATINPILQIARLLNSLEYEVGQEVLKRHPIAQASCSSYPSQNISMDMIYSGVHGAIYDLLEDLTEVHATIF